MAPGAAALFARTRPHPAVLFADDLALLRRAAQNAPAGWRALARKTIHQLLPARSPSSLSCPVFGFRAKTRTARNRCGDATASFVGGKIAIERDKVAGAGFRIQRVPIMLGNGVGQYGRGLDTGKRGIRIKAHFGRARFQVEEVQIESSGSIGGGERLLSRPPVRCPIVGAATRKLPGCCRGRSRRKSPGLICSSAPPAAAPTIALRTNITEPSTNSTASA